jgi:hypothetical protein
MTPEENIFALATLFGETKGANTEAKIEVGSSIINRRDELEGADYIGLLRMDYPSVSDPEGGVQQVIGHGTQGKPFKSDKDENDFKETVQTWYGLRTGNIPVTDTYWYYNSTELKERPEFKRVKSTGRFRMNGRYYNKFARGALTEED